MARDEDRESLPALPAEPPSEEDAEALQAYNELKEKLEKYDALDAEMLPDGLLDDSKNALPLDVHISLLKMAYQLEMWNEFDELLGSAEARIKYRRFEKPFIASLDVIISKDPEAPPPPGF